MKDWTKVQINEYKRKICRLHKSPDNPLGLALHTELKVQADGDSPEKTVTLLEPFLELMIGDNSVFFNSKEEVERFCSEILKASEALEEKEITI